MLTEPTNSPVQTNDESSHSVIAESLKKLIVHGVYERGQKLPSIRQLAGQLDVARSTILRSFDHLSSLGYVRTVRGCGSFVPDVLPGDPVCAWEQGCAPRLPSTDLSTSLSNYARNLIAIKNHCQHNQPLNDGGPKPDQSPIHIWKELIRKHSRFQNIDELTADRHPFGYLPLREAYAGYLSRQRAVRCTASQVIVFSARELRMDLICKLFLNPGDVVAVENPGYPSIRGRLLSYDARIIPVTVDHQGMNIDELVQIKPSPRLVYVTPSHHEPTGAVMPPARRRKLLQWANSTGALIIEDDYDSEYRYSGRPLPSLQGMDEGDSVIHLSCLWKVLSPVERLGFLVVPQRTVALFERAKSMVEKDMSTLDQLVLTDFITEGHLARFTRRSRRVYAERRKALVDALIEHFGASVRIAPESAGMDLLVGFRSDRDDSDIVKLAQDARLNITSTHPYYFGPAKKGEFIIPFALYDQYTLQDGVKALAAAMLEPPAVTSTEGSVSHQTPVTRR